MTNCKKCEKEIRYSESVCWGGYCFWCYHEIQQQKEKEDEFYHAQKYGEATMDNKIMCPYCSEVVDCDASEYIDDDEFNCPECGKESDLEVEWDFRARTIKKEAESNAE